jgi:hypothetical protein
LIDTARTLCPPGGVLELTVRGTPRWFARGPRRYFIPQESWRVRRSGSRIFPALRWKARAYRALLRSWITVGGGRLTHATGPGRAGGWPLGELLLPDMPTLSTAAVSIGIPGPGQKITVQLMDGRGRVLGFAKYADKPYTRELMVNEARMLSVIPKGVGPSLVCLTPFMEGDLLVQTALPGRTRAPRLRLDAAQMRFFERLVQPGKPYAADEHPFVQSLRPQSGGYRAGALRDTIEEIVETMGDVRWPVVWSHGDMAPWNMYVWRNECVAFDWEHGREVGFAYLDAAATLIQVATIIQRATPQRAKRDVSRELGLRLPERYAGFAPALASLSAVNMLVSWYPPRRPDANQRWLEAFVSAPAKGES